MGPSRCGEGVDLIQVGDGAAAQDIVKVGEGGEAAAAGAGDEGVEDGGSFPGFGIADEQVVFLADGAGADGVFDEVVVEFDPAVFQITGEALSLAEGVGEGLAKLAFGEVTVAAFEPEQGFFHPLQDGRGLGLPDHLTGFSTGGFPVPVGLAQGFFDLIEVLDLPEKPAGPLGGFLPGFVNIPPDVGHARAESDVSITSFSEGWITDITIALQDSFPAGREDFLQAPGGAAGEPVEDGVAPGPVDGP